MRKLLFLLLTTIPISILAHPGIGIVCDSKGNIFYTDLTNIYRIDANGDKRIVVPGVHSHELSIDAEDNIYGEHLWYNGERADTWGHYVWCLKANGEVVKVKEPTPGFLTDYGFLRDSSGNEYWIERFVVSRFKKKSPDGKITTLAEGKFRNIRWSYCTKGGIIYFMDLERLYKINTDGKISLVADRLNDVTPGFGMYREQHNAYGIWTDQSDNVYVALHAGQQVKRIRTNGSQETVAYSTLPWSPTGGVFDHNGDLWLLEATLTNDVRVRKITVSELKNKPIPVKHVLKNFALPIGIAAGLLTLSFVGVKKLLSRKRAYT